jgi:phosphate transport system protein
MMRPHTSREFEEELAVLSRHVQEMGQRCQRSVELALAAFWDGSAAAYHEVQRLDRLIDDDERTIDALVLRILALRQPVAEDLRVLTATFKLTTDLERIGDEARNIAAHAEEARGPAKDVARGEVEKMARAVQGMLEGAVRAFVCKDAELAREVMARDAAVDEGYGHVLAEMAQHMRTDPQGAAAAVRVIKIARYLERIGDHATNLAEQTIFAVEGTDIRHTDQA